LHVGEIATLFGLSGRFCPDAVDLRWTFPGEEEGDLTVAFLRHFSLHFSAPGGIDVDGRRVAAIGYSLLESGNVFCCILWCDALKRRYLFFSPGL